MGNKLKSLIESKGYSVKTFAEHIGIPATNIYNVTQGKRDINGLSYRLYKAIAHGLDLTTDELDEYLHS